MSTLLFAALLFIACTPARSMETPVVPSPISVISLPPTATFVPTAALPTAAASATASPRATKQPTPSPRPTVAPFRVVTPTPLPPTPISRITPVRGAQCPFNVPVKIVAPGVDLGRFEWRPVIQPRGDACVSKIRVAPNDRRTWYVGGQNALYITRDEGATWERPLEGQVSAVELDPRDPNRVVVGFQVAKKVYESTDQGRHWRLLKQFDQAIVSILVAADGVLYVGVAWSSSPSPNGVYISRDRGATWNVAPFGTAHRGLILWDIEQDPRDQTLYVGTEIYDHPKPYKPPLFRSRDMGKSWQEITGTLTWHVVEIQVSPRDGYVYALTEGAGLYGSADHGDRWKWLSTGPTVSLLLDPNHANRLYGGAQFNPEGTRDGGVFVSEEEGKTLVPIGLRGVTVSALWLSPDSATLYAAAYASGIYTARIK